MSPLVRHADSVDPVPCPCGQARRIVTIADGAPASLHHTTIFTAERHYHKKTTELYSVLTGQGRIELDGEWHDVRPGSVVLIPAGTRHRIISEQGLVTVVVAVPPFDPADEFVDIV